MSAPRFRLFWRLLVFHVAHGRVAWRWWLLFVWFGVVALCQTEWTRYDFGRQVKREVNVWDLFPNLLSDQPALLCAFALGFALVAGDGMARARSSGAAALALSRVPSRWAWWASRLTAVGVAAAGCVAVGLAATLLVAPLRLPLALGPSPTASTLLVDEMLYPRWMDMSMPLFTLVIAARAVLGLWVLGAVLELSSLFSRRALVPVLGTLGWVLLSWGGVSEFFRAAGPLGWWLNLGQLISYVRLLDPDGPAVSTFLLDWAAVMLAILFAGAWRLRRMDVV